jgi:dolichyl-phosphate-mannose--protein O-mannosyl transferase
MITPTLMAYQDLPAGTSDCISTGNCILSWSTISNPFLWYPAVLAALILLVISLRNRSVFSALVVSGVVAAFVPWLFIQRDEYFYYMIAGLPFLVLCLILVLRAAHARWVGTDSASRVSTAMKLYFAVAAVGGLFFVPMALHAPMPDWFWNLHIWIPTWGEAAFEHVK